MHSCSKIDLALALNLCAKLALASYFFWDHWMFANKIGWWKPKDPKAVDRMGKLTEGSWLAEIVLSLLESCVRLANLSGAPPSPAVS